MKNVSFDYHADSFGLVLPFARVCLCKRRLYRIVGFIFRSCSGYIKIVRVKGAICSLAGDYGGRAPIINTVKIR